MPVSVVFCSILSPQDGRRVLWSQICSCVSCVVYDSLSLYFLQCLTLLRSLKTDLCTANRRRLTVRVAASRLPRCTDPGTDVCNGERGQTFTTQQLNVKETIRFSPVPPTPGWWRPWRGACCCTTLGNCGRSSRRWRTERRNQPAAARYLNQRMTGKKDGDQ